MSADSGYVPGKPWNGDGALARYLPRLEAGVVTKLLERHAEGGGVVIDPFGASPSLALEAAESGRQILVAANNPIAKFLIEVAASAPSRAELQAALAELAAARRGQERLEPHILSLYATECDHCGRPVTADVFLWNRDEQTPYARIYRCPHCENSGEFPATSADKIEAAKFTSSGLHRSRALERIAPIGSPYRQHAEDALDVYPPRAMYALSILVNKLDGLSIDIGERKLLEALMLYTLDRSNSMWSHRRGRTRPKQLSVPAVYQEYNIWHSLERAVSVWETNKPPVEVQVWPNFPKAKAGICLYDGRMRDLSRELDRLEIGAVLGAFPRPNQAYWTLSALWSGWLWGHEALGAFESVLGRRRYDWAWHTNALFNALHRLRDHLQEGIPVLGLVTESEARFEAAVMIAANQAGMRLKHVDLRPQEGQSQFTWHIGDQKEKPLAGRDLVDIVQDSAAETLKAIGQPSELSRLQAAVLNRFDQERLLSSLGNSAAEIYSQYQSVMELALSSRGRFKRFGGGEGDLETGLWWLQESGPTHEPLNDQIEVATVNYLLKNPGTSLKSIDEEICRLFPGRLTPERGLIDKIVNSYGREEKSVWFIHPSDSPGARRDDLAEIHELLVTLGERLGYRVVHGDSILWRDEVSDPAYCFHLQASAILSTLLDHNHDSKNAFIVLPGGRAELVLFKLKQDARIQEIIETGWHFIKFRAVRRLATNPAVQRESIDELFVLDPLVEDDPQLPLL